jgi:Na+-transporting NADH:ubiquinone oxidoreductase subunit NqrC
MICGCYGQPSSWAELYLEGKKMTSTTLILIVVVSLVCSIIAIYFYDRKLMKEILKYEKKMYKKKKGNG